MHGPIFIKSVKQSDFLKTNLVYAAEAVPRLTSVTTTVVLIKTTASNLIGLAYAPKG